MNGSRVLRCTNTVQKEEQKMSVRPDDGWYVLFSEQDQLLLAIL